MVTNQPGALDKLLALGSIRFQTSDWHQAIAIQLPFVLTACGELHNLGIRQTVLWEPFSTKAKFQSQYVCAKCHKVVPFPGVKREPTAQAQGDAQTDHPGHGPGQGAAMPQVGTQERREA